MLDSLLARQLESGGWSFRGTGSAWTEPTCYSLLALLASGQKDSSAFRKGAEWLKSRQKPDGSWTPRDGVTDSTWVTALAGLACGSANLDFNRKGCTDWLLAQTGRETSFVERLRTYLLGASPDPAFAHDGWPWFPGAAAWVTPTAVTVLALQKLGSGDSRIAQRVSEGREFLLARRCRDGGWNHGSTKALGYDADSYPETTGIAMLALSGAPAAANALPSLKHHLETCRSLEGACWLTLGMLAHGQPVTAPAISGKNGTIETALSVIVPIAIGGKNVFL